MHQGHAARPGDACCQGLPAPQAAAPAQARHRSRATAAAPRPHATPGGPPDEARGTLLVLGLHEWMLAVPRPCARPGTAGLRGLAQSLAHGRPEAEAAGQAVVRLLDSLIGPDYGAVLSYRAGRATIYCPASEVTRHAARALSVLLTRSGAVAVRPGPAREPRAVAVTPLPHDDFPAPFHPAAAVARGARTDFYVCSSLITPLLAAGIAWLCDAQAALLARS